MATMPTATSARAILQEGGYNGMGFYVKPGQMVAHEYPLPRSPRSVVLLGIHAMHPHDGDGMTFRYGMRTTPGGLFDGRHGWRPRAWHAPPVAGFVVPAKTEGIMEIGISSTQPGVHCVRGSTVDYRMGDFTYSAPQQFEIDLCVARAGP